ncbi:MAG TPA: FISUMP domain-containing protein, partial [Tenuifilaceae bacterium]|nr:FISUMP domain-containing protein [Tenuifilaceae bacterium]
MKNFVNFLVAISAFVFLTNFNVSSQGTVTDIDGNIYPTVIIGSQEWMTVDLKVSKYRNGDAILTDQSHNQWQQSTQGIWAYYDNDPSNNDLYGKLYNWYATVDPRGLCPLGWRTPTDNDWQILEEYIDPTDRGNKNHVGKKLKSRRQINSPFGGEYNTTEHPRWDDHPVNYGTDEYSFSSLPGGGYTNGHAFRHLGQEAYYWSSTEAQKGHAWSRILTFSNLGTSRGGLQKSLGASVRCVKGVEQAVELPQVNTVPASNVSLNSATSGGDVLADGGAPVTARGVVWSTAQNPKVEDNMGITTDGSGLGIFTSNITGLNPGTIYWVRAYATNSAGTEYGIQVKVTTYTQVGLPAVTTSQVTNITSISAVSGGNVTSEGGLPVSARGVVWSTAQNPTLETNEGFTIDGAGSGIFYSTIQNLSPDITYYVRAYATNSEGTSYGSVIYFQTLSTVNPDECLMAWYPFNGNANDASVFENHGIVNGATLVADRHGIPNSAYRFDGNDWIEALHKPQIDFDIYDEYTISVWAKISTNQINYGSIIDKWVNSYNPYPYTIRCYGPSSSIGTSVVGARYIGGMPQDYTRNQTVRISDGEIEFEANKYHHIVVVFNSDKIKLFVNGSLVKTSTNQMISGNVSNTYNLFIGRRSGREDRFFNGEIDDIKIYNCALDEASIDGIYNEESNASNELTLISNPELGGVLTGAGTYPVGSGIDINAIPNQGYQFVNWTIDGEIVST